MFYNPKGALIDYSHNAVKACYLGHYNLFSEPVTEKSSFSNWFRRLFGKKLEITTVWPDVDFERVKKFYHGEEYVFINIEPIPQWYHRNKPEFYKAVRQAMTAVRQINPNAKIAVYGLQTMPVLEYHHLNYLSSVENPNNAWWFERQSNIDKWNANIREWELFEKAKLLDGVYDEIDIVTPSVYNKTKYPVYIWWPSASKKIESIFGNTTPFVWYKIYNYSNSTWEFMSGEQLSLYASSFNKERDFVIWKATFADSDKDVEDVNKLVDLLDE
jgi:hypothetical protein